MQTTTRVQGSTLAVRPEAVPKYQRDSFGRVFARAVLKQFEDPKIAEEFEKWLNDRRGEEDEKKTEVSDS